MVEGDGFGGGGATGTGLVGGGGEGSGASNILYLIRLKKSDGYPWITQLLSRQIQTKTNLRMNCGVEMYLQAKDTTHNVTMHSPETHNLHIATSEKQ